MHYKIRERWLNLKYFLIPNKHYVISGFLFITFIIVIFSFSSPLASKSNVRESSNDNKSSNFYNVKLQNISTQLGKPKGNLLYPFFRMDLEDSEDFLIEEGIIEYDGYFRQMEFQTYKIKRSDTLSKIARRFKSNIDTIISFNRIKGPKSLTIGKLLFIPNMKGILHKIKKGETLRSVAKKYKKYNVRLDDISYINEIIKNKRITVGERLFIPGAKLPKESPLRKLKDVNIFAHPVKGILKSGVGRRRHPILGRYKFHSGLDIKARYGSPVRSTQRGRVKFAGWKRGYGKVIIIDHGKGLETRYGHLSRILVRRGMWVKKRKVIGKVGSTGLSTGPHLHFEVRKHGRAQTILKNKSLKGLEGRKGGKW